MSRHPTTVAVIGAGVSGLCAANYLLAERLADDPNNSHFKVTVFERRGEAGGIWNQTPEDDLYATPMYQSCNTNVPRTMMEYEGVQYPVDTPLFPRNSVVKEYLHCYARKLEDKDIMAYNSEVTLVKHVQKNYNKKWKIDVKNTITGSTEVKYFDCVIVALGTFTQPSVPASFIPKPGFNVPIIHSKHYRGVEQFESKRVLIVGNGPSYWDMSGEISKVCRGELLVSVRREETIQLNPNGNQQQVSEVLKIEAISPRRSRVHFKPGPFFIKPVDVDIILLCTGYEYQFPMIPCIKTTKDRKRVLSLYDHIICIKEDSDPTGGEVIKDDLDTEPEKKLRSESTLAFVGLLKMDNVFLMAEAQSALIARYFSGRWTKPQSEMKEERTTKYNKLKEKELCALMKSLRKDYSHDTDHDRKTKYDKLMNEGQHSSGRFHNMAYPDDADYVDRIFNQCVEVEWDRTGTGKTPPFHSLYLHWLRQPGQIGLIRNSFINTGPLPNENKAYPSPESLGFELSPYEGSVKREEKTEMMEDLRILMEEKSTLWKKKYMNWEAASEDWVKRWRAKLDESDADESNPEHDGTLNAAMAALGV